MANRSVKDSVIENSASWDSLTCTLTSTLASTLASTSEVVQNKSRLGRSSNIESYNKREFEPKGLEVRGDC